MRLLCVLLFLLFEAFYCKAQNVLVVCITGTPKSVRFVKGDNIGVKITGDNKIYKGIITQIKDSSFRLIEKGRDEKEIFIPDVEIVVDYERFWGLGLLSRVAITAGTGFFLLDTFNRTINGDSPIVEDRTAKAGLMISSFGIVLIPISRKYHRIGEKRTIKILDFENEKGASF